MQFQTLWLIALFASSYAQTPPTDTIASPLVDPNTNAPLFIPGLSPSGPAVTPTTDPAPPVVPPVVPPTPATPAPIAPPVAPSTPPTDNSFLPPPPILPPPTNNALPPPPVLPQPPNTSPNTNAPSDAPDNNNSTINTKSKGLVLTADALLDPDIDALIRAVRQVFVRANRTSFNASDALGGTKAGINADMNVDVNGTPVTAKRFSFSIDNNFLATNKVKMDTPPNRVEQSLNLTYVRPLVDRLNKSGLFARTLNIVPDAHNNIITAAEFANLATIGITIEELRDIGTRNYIAYTQMNFICLARQSKVSSGVTEEVVFIRTSAKEWNMARADVAKLVAKKTTNTTIFDPKAYHPHIAIAWTGTGFIWTDDEIGAGDQRCFAEIALVDPKQKKKANAIVASTNDVPLAPVWSASVSKKPTMANDESMTQRLSRSAGVALVDEELMDERPRNARHKRKG